MIQIKVVQRSFGAISTSLDDGSNLSESTKKKVIESWRPSASKIRVFGTPIPVISGITNVRSLTPIPSLKAMFEDYHLAVRGTAPMVLTSATNAIKPVCLQLTEYAETKSMGISWAFYAYSEPGETAPSVFGLTAPVVKILAAETPKDIFFEDGKWQDWMFTWIRKFMQSHRFFDATRFLVANKWPKGPPLEFLTDGPINVYEKMGEVAESYPEVVAEAPKKRGRKPKAK